MTNQISNPVRDKSLNGANPVRDKSLNGANPVRDKSLNGANGVNKIQFLTMPDCHNCEAAKKIFDEIMPDFPNMEVEEIDMTTPEGQELVQKYGIMSSPGIVINGELFSSGGVSREKLVEKLKSLK